jgi:hypothetical protein
MKARKIMATVSEEGQLTLDQPLISEKNSRVEVIILIPEEETLDTPSQSEVLDDLRQAWHEAMTGQTIPVAQLWDGIENV